MKNITYTERNGIRYPDLALPEQTNYPLGKYANLHLDFMKKHRKGRYTTLLTEGRLNEYLHAIDIRAHELLDDIIPRPLVFINVYCCLKSGILPSRHSLTVLPYGAVLYHPYQKLYELKSYL